MANKDYNVNMDGYVKTFTKAFGSKIFYYTIEEHKVQSHEKEPVSILDEVLDCGAK